ncbi:MAG TPA: TPM domain-containing protein [Rhodocyclaceae bacterium]|nr:TPM domain-containing protein [Rhodocyclaceae bacterium]
MKTARLLKHLATPGWLAWRRFRPADREAIRAAVAASEESHRGELRIVIEGPLPVTSLWRGHSTRQRAAELFHRFGVGNTHDATGILIYVQLVDRHVEVLADRGIDARVAQSEWEIICREMEAAFSDGAWRRGVLDAIDRATRLLALHFPARPGNPNELDDRPKLL